MYIYVKNKVSKKLNLSIEDFSLYLEAKIWGYTYTPQKNLCKFNNDFEIYKIMFIIHTSTDILFCCNKYSTVFNTHYAAFEFESLSNIYNIINVSEIVGPPFELLESTKGKLFLKPKEFYSNIY